MNKAIVIGLSSGGMSALSHLFSVLPASFATPIIIVQHIGPRSDSEWIKMFRDKSGLKISEAGEKEEILPGHIYVAPPNYHLLIETDRTFTLTIDERVNFARPSIDVLFQSAADAYGKDLTGILLTGANGDGAEGLLSIHRNGGYTMVEDPKTATSSMMPQSALDLFQPDHVLPLKELFELLIKKETNQSTE